MLCHSEWKTGNGNDYRNVEQPLEAAAAAICAMGIAGEIGFEHLREGEGNSTYRNRIIDAIYHMDGNTLEARAKYELR